MGVARLIRRTAPLIVVGLAGAAAARRRAVRMRQAQLTPPPYPPPVATVEPVVEAEPQEVEPQSVEPEPQEPEPEPEPEEQPAHEEEPQTVEISSVTEIVDDLLTPGEAAERIEDATVVEEEDAPPDDDALAATVRGRLAEQPGLLPGTVDVQVEQGTVRLTGEVERVEAITELERRAGEVPGVRSVRTFLHLPGTPPPSASEQR